jgi:predicted N-acetyltransferase YhbS
MEISIQNHVGLVEVVRASILLVRNYQMKGYLATKGWKSLCACGVFLVNYIMRAWKFSIFPSSGTVVVATNKTSVIGTVMLWFTPRITPIDKIFPEAMALLRKECMSFVYIGSFAVSPEYVCTRVSLRMLRAVLDTVKAKGVDVGVCVVHPDHCTLYKRFGFKEVGSSTIPGLANAKAALLVVKKQDVRL